MESEPNCLIFDLGGKTFDVSQLAIEEEFLEVQTIVGDIHLEGNNFDNKIIELCVADF